VPFVLVFFTASLLGLKELIRNPRLARWIAPWLVIPPITVFLVGWLMANMTYQVRYTLASLPAFVLVLAIGVRSLKGALRWAAGGAVLAVSLLSLSNMYWAEEYHKADVRGALERIRLKDSDEAQVLVVGQVELALPFYADIPGMRVVSCAARRNQHSPFPHVDPGIGDHAQSGLFDEMDPNRKVWVLAGRDWEGDATRCLQLLSSSHSTVEQVSFTGVDLWCVEPRINGNQDAILRSR
jgi:hypothetical protein